MIQKLLLVATALFGFPALYLLAIVYTATPVEATVAARKLDVRLGSGSRGGKKLNFDMELRFRTAAGQELTWKEQLPTRFVEEALMLFDDYPPGRPAKIFQYKNEAVLRRGLPDWRFGLGWGLAVFALVFLLFSYISGRLPKPQRMFAVMGLFPLVGGVLLYQSLQAKITSWPRVQAVVVKAPTLAVLASRGLDLRVDWAAQAFLKDAELDSIHYTFQGREYLFPGDDDVYAYSNAEHASYEKIVDPDDPSKLAEIPGEGDDTFTGAYVLLGFGVVFVLIGLLIP